MARPLRIEYPNAVYHVTSRGNARNKIFIGDQDRENFLFVLNTVIKKYNWLCHAYCLMDNHYHLMIETPDANLSHGSGAVMVPRQASGMCRSISR